MSGQKTHAGTKRSAKSTSKILTGGQVALHAVLRDAVFTMSPLELREFLEQAKELEVLQEPEDLLEDESEQEDVDVDEIEGTEEANSDWKSASNDVGDAGEFSTLSSVRPGEKINFSLSPILDISNNYPIHINRTEQHAACFFEAPSWMRWYLADAPRDFVLQLVSFLESLSQWLQENKQPFLCVPTPENFALGETAFHEKPLVTQEGFLQAVTRRQVPAMKLSNERFNRLLGKIWLIWPEWNMPLAALFEAPFRVSWVAAGCLHGIDRQIWQEYSLAKLSKKQLSDVKPKAFANLDMNERLHWLSARAKVSEEAVLRMIKTGKLS